jgi:hypothetical protein
MSVAIKTVCRFKINHSSGKSVLIKKKIPSFNETVCAGLAVVTVNTYVATGYEF